MTKGSIGTESKFWGQIGESMCSKELVKELQPPVSHNR